MSATRGRANAEFTDDVKAAVAAEAGYRCANPRCLAPTHAAGDTKRGEGKVGQAAHISAAAPEFARWRPRMDPLVRKSAANGIWLCNIHAREIDVDAERFTENLLHGWKRRARSRAYATRGMQVEPSEPPALIRHTAWLGSKVDRPSVGKFVGDFLTDTGARWLWSSDAEDAIRMALYELAINAIEHGGATHLHLRARGYRIDLTYVGPDFDPNRLSLETGDGGAEALAHLRAVLGDALALTYTHNGNVATIRLIDVASAGPDQPCATRITDLRSGWEVAFRSCSAVHLFCPEPMSFSDLGLLIGARVQELVDDQPGRTVFVHGLSAPLAESAQRRFPGTVVVV